MESSRTCSGEDESFSDPRSKKRDLFFLNLLLLFFFGSVFVSRILASPDSGTLTAIQVLILNCCKSSYARR